MSAALNVISFSLYGAQRIYCEGALRNLELAPLHYPGWICRFYLDDSVPPDYRAQLAARGAQIIRVTKPALGPMYGRYWRFWIAADPDVARFIVRDVDSRLNPRERAAVDDWIASGKSFHLMRDHVHHKTRALAGMWGGLGGSLPDIAALVDGWGRFDEQGQNDQFVSDILFPLMRHDYVCHDGAGYFDDGRPFPAHPPLSGTRHVGEVVDDDAPAADIWRESGEWQKLLLLERERAKDLSAQIDTLTASLKISEADRAARLAQIETLTERLRISEDDRAARLAQIKTLTARLQLHEADAAARQAEIHALSELERKSGQTTKMLEATLTELKQSTSWRVTRPLRAASTLITRWLSSAPRSFRSAPKRQARNP